jgi:hypothetical protein
MIERLHNAETRMESSDSLKMLKLHVLLGISCPQLGKKGHRPKIVERQCAMGFENRN